MTANLLSLIAGAGLSLAFSYIPGLRDRFEQLTPEGKRLVMLGMLVLLAAAIYGLSCAGLGTDLNLPVACDQKGLIAVVEALLLAAVANQTAYALSPGVHK